METLDYDYTMHARQGAGDDNLLVKFYVDAVKDEKASLEEGRPVFKDVEFIDIRIPGNKDNIVVRPVRAPSDMERFPRHYAAFKARVSQETVVGTPLAQWPNPAMTPSRIAELYALNIRTVEQIVATPDSVTQKVMGFQTLKNSAVTYLEITKSSAPIGALTKKLDDALAIIETQGRELARLTAIAGEKKGK